MTQPLIITAEEIEAGRSERGGWTRATLAGWGVPWPPPKGWRKALIRGQTPSYRARREDTIQLAIDAAQLALSEQHNGNRAWAERWLIAAYHAGKEIR